MPKARKQVPIQVTVSVPVWMTASEARREVRTLINDQCNYMCLGPEGQQVETDTVRAVRVAPTTDNAIKALRAFVSACGGNPPDWLADEFAMAENVIAEADAKA